MSQRGISLLEILVVIGVIALLLALALPAGSYARALSVDASCRSNLRSLFQAQQTYAVDYQQFVAVWTESDPVSWRLRLDEHVPGSRSVSHCPHVPEELSDDGNGGATIENATYGLNGAMQFSQWGFRPQRVPQPATIIAIAEQAPTSLETAVTADGFGVWATPTATNWFGAPWHDASGGYRHPGVHGANVAMMDGSAQRLTHQQLYRESGHWYWFDALANDMAYRGDAEEYDALPNSPSPFPLEDVLGPYVAPCGCPVDI